MQRATAYTFPPESYEFEREGQYLFFDPQNFLWFKTDLLGKMTVNCLQQAENSGEAAAALAQATENEPEHAAVYVDRWLTKLFDHGFLQRGKYVHNLPTVVLGNHPVDLYVHMTGRCNLRCLYCYNMEHRDLQRKVREGSRDDFLNLIDEAAELGIRCVRITGGEALLSPITLPLARRAHDYGIETNLLTNSILITQELAAQIAEAVDVISISLDSADPKEHNLMRGKNTHAQVLRSIRRLKKAGVGRLHLNAVITPTNKGSISRFLAFAWDELGADRVTLAPSELELPDPHDRLSEFSYVLAPEEITEIHEEEKEFYRQRGQVARPERSDLWRCQCGAANGVISIDANGDIYPCQTMHGPEFLCGNAFEDGLANALENSAVLNRLKKLTVDTIDGCNRCAMRYLCAGGCRMMAHYHEGRVDARIRRYCKSLFQGALDQLWQAADSPAGTTEPLATTSAPIC